MAIAARLACVAAFAVAGAVAWLALGGRPAEPARSSRHVLRATPASLDRVFARAAGGATILLAPGDYGGFAAGVKPSTVTIRPRPGAVARMRLALAGAAHVRFEGLTIERADISGPSHDLTIAGSTFRGQAVIHADRMADADVVLERNRFAGIDVCHDCYEGRLHVLGSSGRSSGVVLRDNVLGPGGNADGIQVSADGVVVAGNTFVGIHRDPGDSPHTDALQLFGQRRTVVRGNLFRDVATAIMAPDGGDHEVIERNVIDTGGYPYAIMLGGDDGSTIRHNTMAQLGGCAWDAPCGTLLLGPGPTGRPGRGTVVQDNILGRLSLTGGSTLGADGHNLIAVEDGAPARDSARVPVFAGGAHPSSRAGFRLTARSPGRLAASDGTDVGA